jgi:hypothetical protein
MTTTDALSLRALGGTSEESLGFEPDLTGAVFFAVPAGKTRHG